MRNKTRLTYILTIAATLTSAAALYACKENSATSSSGSTSNTGSTSSIESSKTTENSGCTTADLNLRFVDQKGQPYRNLPIDISDKAQRKILYQGITDSNGDLFAKGIPCTTVVVDPSLTKDSYQRLDYQPAYFNSLAGDTPREYMWFSSRLDSFEIKESMKRIIQMTKITQTNYTYDKNNLANYNSMWSTTTDDTSTSHGTRTVAFRPDSRWIAQSFVPTQNSKICNIGIGFSGAASNAALRHLSYAVEVREDSNAQPGALLARTENIAFSQPNFVSTFHSGAHTLARFCTNNDKGQGIELSTGRRIWILVQYESIPQHRISSAYMLPTSSTEPYTLESPDASHWQIARYGFAEVGHNNPNRGLFCPVRTWSASALQQCIQGNLTQEKFAIVLYFAE